MSYKFTVSVHKGNCSESHLGHNRRTIFVPSADEKRLHLDEAIIDEPIEIAYQKLFGSATEQYNRGKKPSRQIPNYYEHIKAQYEKGEAKLQQAISKGASKAELRRVKSSYPKMYHELLLTVGSSSANKGLFSSKGITKGSMLILLSQNSISRVITTLSSPSKVILYLLFLGR